MEFYSIIKKNGVLKHVITSTNHKKCTHKVHWFFPESDEWACRAF